MFAADTGTVHIEKRYRVDTTRYRLQLDVVGQPTAATRRSDQHLAIWRRRAGRIRTSKGGGFFSGVVGQHSRRRSATSTTRSSASRSRSSARIRSTKRSGTVNWIGDRREVLPAGRGPVSRSRRRASAPARRQPLGTDVGAGDAAFAERAVPPQAERQLLVRGLRGPEGHRRPRGQVRRRAAQRRSRARQGGRRHAWPFCRGRSCRCSSSSTASPTTGAWRSSC